MSDMLQGSSSSSSSSSGPATRSLNHQTVLEEEEYTEALSKIIARDFFPSLVHLDATNDYLDALQTRDPHLIQASVRRLQDVSFTPAGPSTSTRRWSPSQTPSRTPYGLAGETPLHSVRGEPPQKKARYDTNMSLDEFQARYTSEDNSSFTQILDEENQVRREKWAWAWNAQKRVEDQQTKMIEQRKTMLIEPPRATGVKEKFTIEAPRPVGLITGSEEEVEKEKDKDKEEEGKALVPTTKSGTEVATQDGVVNVMAPQKDTRPAGVDGWKFKARNSLMFAPDADESPYHAKITPKPELNLETVNYASTRLSEQGHTVGDSRSMSAPPSPTRSRIDAAISGTPYIPSSARENGFNLVPNVPSPTPAELGPAALKQLMTWGTLNSTPRIIGQTGGDPADIRTPFHIPNISAREAISHKLSDNAAKSLRAKAELMNPSKSTPRNIKSALLGQKGTMGPPSRTPRRAEPSGNLTPAARRLLERTTMGTAAARRAEAMERNAGWESGKGKEKDFDRVRWTPTPTPVHRRG